MKEVKKIQNLIDKLWKKIKVKLKLAYQDLKDLMIEYDFIKWKLLGINDFKKK